MTPQQLVEIAQRAPCSLDYRTHERTITLTVAERDELVALVIAYVPGKALSNPEVTTP